MKKDFRRRFMNHRALHLPLAFTLGAIDCQNAAGNRFRPNSDGTNRLQHLVLHQNRVLVMMDIPRFACCCSRNDGGTLHEFRRTAKLRVPMECILIMAHRCRAAHRLNQNFSKIPA